MIGDDNMPDDDNLARELELYHFLANKGQIVRNGIVFDAEHDVFTRTALLAMLREVTEHLRNVNIDRERLAQELEAVVGIQRETVHTLERALAECARLQDERDCLQHALLARSGIIQ